jgi:hypothetical protein
MHSQFTKYWSGNRRAMARSCSETPGCNNVSPAGEKEPGGNNVSQARMAASTWDNKVFSKNFDLDQDYS